MKVRIILPVCLFLAGLFFAPRCAEAHETVMMTEKSDSVYLKVVKSPDEGFNEEVVRVIESMPKWKPARVKGKKVACRMNLPILFRLP